MVKMSSKSRARNELNIYQGGVEYQELRDVEWSRDDGFYGI